MILSVEKIKRSRLDLLVYLEILGSPMKRLQLLWCGSASPLDYDSDVGF